MRILEIKALENGAHRSMDGDFDTAPVGWAVMPDDVQAENFPFGDPAVNGDGVVTGWTPGTMPEAETARPEEAQEDSAVWDALDRAYSEGVDLV